MRPTDIEIPFEWDDRKIMIHDRVWYIPGLLKSEQQFTFPGWNSPEIFGNDNPVVIEYCSGNGAWIADRAIKFPHLNWVAIEMKYQRVRKIWSKIKNSSLPNLFVICSEAMRATKEYFPPSSVSAVYINFPDPWPKNRHAKNRLIRPDFLQQLNRILQPDGTVTFVTDDAAYSSWTINTFSKDPTFRSKHDHPCFVTEMPDYGTSYFEDLWREKGKLIRYHQFIKEREATS